MLVLIAVTRRACVTHRVTTQRYSEVPRDAQRYAKTAPQASIRDDDVCEYSVPRPHRTPAKMRRMTEESPFGYRHDCVRSPRRERKAIQRGALTLPPRPHWREGRGSPSRKVSKSPAQLVTRNRCPRVGAASVVP